MEHPHSNDWQILTQWRDGKSGLRFTGTLGGSLETGQTGKRPRREKEPYKDTLNFEHKETIPTSAVHKSFNLVEDLLSSEEIGKRLQFTVSLSTR